MQNERGSMELLPSGSCCLFTVVSACVHDIAQLGRYLEFLGFISNQSCAQSLVSKDEKNHIVWWTMERLEEYPPGKLMLTEHLAWAAPAAWHTWYAEPWGWIPPTLLHGRKSCSRCLQAAFALQSTGELSYVLSPHVPLPAHPCREGVAVPLRGSSRAVTAASLVFPSCILCPCLHFWIKQFNFVLLLPLLRSLLWHSFNLSAL